MSQFLVGKTINGLKIANDQTALLFECNDGNHIARCDADCCSFTWVEHIELPVLGFPAKVIEVLDIDMPDLGEMENRDVVSYYGCKIKTDKGDIVIDYRNDSNGYYGGSLSWPDDNYFYGGVYGQNLSKEDWRETEN